MRESSEYHSEHYVVTAKKDLISILQNVFGWSPGCQVLVPFLVERDISRVLWDLDRVARIAAGRSRGACLFCGAEWHEMEGE